MNPERRIRPRLRHLRHTLPAYPATRIRERTLRRPIEALEQLGLDRNALTEAERGFQPAWDAVVPEMRGRAEAARRPDFVRKLDDPRHPGHASKLLMYLAVRVLRPRIVVETGTFAGVLTSFALQALSENGDSGRLLSLDLPARGALAKLIGIELPPGHEPGWIVPERLLDRVSFIQGDTRSTLPEVLASAGTIDLFVHDSLHTTRHMLFEYRTAWPALREGGLLVSDDVFSNAAFWWFTASRRVPFLHVGNLGVTRKKKRGA
jgi:predicted O-methyltransferase YrrM